MFPSGGNPFNSGGNPFGGGGFGSEPPADGSFGFFGGDDSGAFLSESKLNTRDDDEVIGVGLHFCGRMKE